MSYSRVVISLFCFSALARPDSVTYRVTQGAGACHEVRIPRWSPTAEMFRLRSRVDRSCEFEVHMPGETELYIGMACPMAAPGGEPGHLLERYAVDLRHPKKVTRLDDSAWESAYGLQRTRKLLFEVRLQESGIEYGGHFLKKSGPKWKGISDPEVQPTFSGTHARVALNSWDGRIRSLGWEAPLFFPDKANGQYWIDIYDVRSARRLIQIQGSFHGIESTPAAFQGHAAWYTDQYYVLPLAPQNMRRLLVCDVDAAARLSGSASGLGLKERK